MNTFKVGDRVYFTACQNMVGTVKGYFGTAVDVRLDDGKERLSWPEDIDYYTRPEIGTYITIDSESGFNYGDLFLFDHPERVLIDWISHDGLVMGCPVEELNLTCGPLPEWAL